MSVAQVDKETPLRGASEFTFNRLFAPIQKEAFLLDPLNFLFLFSWICPCLRNVNEYISIARLVTYFIFGPTWFLTSRMYASESRSDHFCYNWHSKKILRKKKKKRHGKGKAGMADKPRQVTLPNSRKVLVTWRVAIHQALMYRHWHFSCISQVPYSNSNLGKYLLRPNLLVPFFFIFFFQNVKVYFKSISTSWNDAGISF